MKRSIKIMICVGLGLVLAGSAIFLIKGDYVQGLMRPAYDTSKCYDSDGGKNYETQGTTYGKMAARNSKTKFTDSCSEDILTEYYCDGNKVSKTTVDGGVKNECKDGKLEKEIHIPVEPGLIEEEEILPKVSFSEGNFTVIVPEGYEALAEKHLDDLQYCEQLLPTFLGMESFYWDKFIIKIYISNDGTQSGSANPIKGVLFYKKSQENIDFNLSDVITNNPEGFLYNSSPSYCANTHEFTHLLVAFTPIPSWANEGIAEYNQKYNQEGSKDYFTCEEDGWSGIDYWGDNQYKKFEYSDLLPESYSNEFGEGAKRYRTYMCFWENFDEKFGAEARRSIFKKLELYNFNYGIDEEGLTSLFVNEFLLPTVNDEPALKEFLEVFGLFEGEDY